MGALVILHKVVNMSRIQSVASDKKAIFTALAVRVCIGFLICLGILRAVTSSSPKNPSNARSSSHFQNSKRSGFGTTYF